MSDTAKKNNAHKGAPQSRAKNPAGSAKGGRPSIYDTDHDRASRTLGGKGGGAAKKGTKKPSFNEHRALKRVIWYVVLAAVVIVTAVTLSMTVLFNITDIKVEIGEGVPYTAEEVLQFCGVKKGDNLFVTSMKDTSERVSQSLPYIENCKVLRRLPSTVVIKTEAAVVMGAVPLDDGTYAVLSMGGRVLEKVDSEKAKQYIRLNGMGIVYAPVGERVEISSEYQLDTAAQIIGGMKEYGLSVGSVTFRENGWVTANHDGRLELIFGTPSDLDEKILLAATLINEGKITKNESGDIDLSMSGRATFKPDYLKK